VIEQAMFFALGFLAAGLFTLMFLPAFWRRAMRLSLRRLDLLTPLSLDKMAAERDLLRAEFAARHRRLEQKMETVAAGKAADMLAIGQGVARIAELDGARAAAIVRGDSFEKKFLETKGFLEERTALLRSTESALNDMTDRVEQLIGNLRNVEMDREALGRLTELHRTQVTRHESSIAGLHVQNAEMRQRLDALQEELARALAEAQRLGDVDAVLAQTTRELDLAIVEKTDIQRTLDDTAARLDALQRSTMAELERLESALRVARAEARDHADRLEAARSDNALLQGAVDALRREHAHLREAAMAGLAAAPAGETGQGVTGQGATGQGETGQGERDVLALRQAIIDLGARMAEMAAAPPTANSNEAAQSKRA
jgi:chromosome segregation ATPase